MATIAMFQDKAPCCASTRTRPTFARLHEARFASYGEASPYADTYGVAVNLVVVESDGSRPGRPDYLRGGEQARRHRAACNRGHGLLRCSVELKWRWLNSDQPKHYRARWKPAQISRDHKSEMSLWTVSCGAARDEDPPKRRSSHRLATARRDVVFIPAKGPFARIHTTAVGVS
jgi:hypothetical protein